jgi:hypothetical protein
MPEDDDSVRRQINLAEFAALRAEIDSRANLSWNIFALQLTAAGVNLQLRFKQPSSYWLSFDIATNYIRFCGAVPFTVSR